MLVNMKELLEYADKKGVCIGAFSVYNMEMVMGVIEACEELDMPAIIQIAESRFKYSPLSIIGPIMIAAAKKAKVKIAVHLDHGLTFDNIERALKYGFTSVMYDGSKLSFNENIENTKKVVEIASKYNASVEAELGVVGGNEGMGYFSVKYTDVEEAKYFVDSTNIDALAIAIGNAHGNYKGEPKLNFKILQEINEEVKKPLVLHGGSGINDEDFQKAIRFGIRKINIATSNMQALVNSIKQCVLSNNSLDYFKLNQEIVNKVKNNTIDLMRVFNMDII